MKHSCTVSEYNLKLYFEAFVVCDWLLDCSVRDTRSVLDRDVYAEANSYLDPVHFCPLLFPPSFFFFIKNSLTEMSVLVVMSRHLDTQWPSVLQFHMPTLQRDEVNWG